MKRIIFGVSLSASLFAFGCNQQGGETTEPASSEAVLLIEGTNPGGFRSALLALSEAEVSADGRRLAASIDEARANLADIGEELSVRFSLPADAENVDVELAFDDYGGYDTADGKGGEIDARGTRIRFQLPARRIAACGQASLRLDLARSLVPRQAERRVLLPHYQLTY